MLKTEARASNIMDTLGYWREYPERDLEHVRRYPCVVEPLDEEDVWTKIPLAVYIRLVGGNGEDPVSLLAGVCAEIRGYAALPYLQEREVRIGFLDAWGGAGVNSQQLAALLESISTLQTAPGAAWAWRSPPREVDGAKAEILARRGFKRALLSLPAPDSVPRGELRLLQEAGIAEVGVELGRWADRLRAEELRPILEDLAAVKATLLSGVGPSSPHADTLLAAGYTPATCRDFLTAPAAMRFPEHIWYYGLDVLGVGPGACGVLKGVVYQNTADPAAYLDALSAGRFPVQEAAVPTARQELLAAVANGFKLLKISRETFKTLQGFDLLQAFGKKIEELAAAGFLELKGDEVMVTYPHGYRGLERIIRSLGG